MSTNNNNGIHISVIGFALLTSLLTALANLVIENITTINIFSFSFFAVIPVGALLIGAIGASGGLLACRYFNIKPNKLDFLFLVLIGAATMYLIYYLGYITLVLDDGTKVSQFVSFGQYVDLLTTKSSLRVGRGGVDTGEVGSFGYLMLLTKFIGVLIGGAAVFGLLKGMAMCHKCNVYYKKIATKETNNMNAEQADAVLANIKEGTIDAYRLAINSNYVDTAKDTNKIKIKFTLMRCPKCNDSFVSEEFFAIAADASSKELKQFNGRTNLPTNSDLALEFKKK